MSDENEKIVSNDHRLQKPLALVEFAREKLLPLSNIITNIIPLNEDALNTALDNLKNFSRLYKNRHHSLNLRPHYLRPPPRLPVPLPLPLPPNWRGK